MTPELKAMKNGDGDLLFNQSHTLMMVLTLDVIKKMVDNADNIGQWHK